MIKQMSFIFPYSPLYLGNVFFFFLHSCKYILLSRLETRAATAAPRLCLVIWHVDEFAASEASDSHAERERETVKLVKFWVPAGMF